MTVFKHQSVLITGGEAGDTAPALEITAGPTVPAGQSLLGISDFFSAPIWFQTSRSSSPACEVWGDRVRARQAPLVTVGVGFYGRSGTRVPAALELAHANSAMAAAVFTGTGAPADSAIVGAVEGDLYFRLDGASGTYVYQCTANGSPGTWAARL